LHSVGYPLILLLFGALRRPERETLKVRLIAAPKRNTLKFYK